jgi:aldose 1-epimerase
MNFVTITDSASGARATVAPELGSNCFQFVVPTQSGEVDVLWSDPHFRTGTARPAGSGIPILCPFPGRIKDGRLAWGGRTYNLLSTDAPGNAIHGFVYDRPWRIVAHTECSLSTQFQASVDGPDILDQWPADFRIDALFRVGGTSLDIQLTVSNSSEQELPFGLGAHPYFRLPIGRKGSPDDCRLVIPVTTNWLLENMNATGRTQPIEECESYGSELRFRDARFDNVFSGMSSRRGRCLASISDPVSGRNISIEYDDRFEYCVVYTPPHRESICIEPYTCVPDAFRLQQQGVPAGLKCLQPGESFEASLRLSCS